MMSFSDMVRNAPNRSEEQMWQSVASISELINDIRANHPDLARKVLMRQYAILYGNHFNEQFARESVASMFHTASNGQRIAGEMVEPDRAFAHLVPDGNTDLFWDAYVGANAFLHDLARTDISEKDILAAAREFWFNDDDFPSKTKVLWYFSNK